MTLRERLSTRTKEELVNGFALELEDWAERDTAFRTIAKRVLSESEVEGDGSGVPCLEEVVELLVKRIESHELKTIP